MILYVIDIVKTFWSYVRVWFPIIWLHALSNALWCRKYYILSPQPWVTVQRLKCHHIFLIKFTFSAYNFFISLLYEFWWPFHSLHGMKMSRQKKLSLWAMNISTGSRTSSSLLSFMIEFYDTNDIANEYSARIFHLLSW